jgi:hypothetical protein
MLNKHVCLTGTYAQQACLLNRHICSTSMSAQQAHMLNMHIRLTNRHTHANRRFKVHCLLRSVFIISNHKTDIVTRKYFNAYKNVTSGHFQQNGRTIIKLTIIARETPVLHSHLGKPRKEGAGAGAGGGGGGGAGAGAGADLLSATVSTVSPGVTCNAAKLSKDVE